MHCLAAMETGFVHSESILIGYILLTKIFFLIEVCKLVKLKPLGLINLFKTFVSEVY